MAMPPTARRSTRLSASGSRSSDDFSSPPSKIVTPNGYPFAEPASSPSRDPSPVRTPSPKRQRRAKRNSSSSRFLASSPPTPLEQQLRDVGYFSPQKDGEGSANEQNPSTFCICNAEEKDVDPEEIIRCSNQNCSPGWYHLSCMNLPSHPPITFHWFCPACIKQGKLPKAKLKEQMKSLVNGLSNGRAPYDNAVCRVWLKEERDAKLKMDRALREWALEEYIAKEDETPLAEERTMEYVREQQQGQKRKRGDIVGTEEMGWNEPELESDALTTPPSKESKRKRLMVS